MMSIDNLVNSNNQAPVPTEHVKPGDADARSADRRDQPGQAFDGNINEHTVGSAIPKSAEINDLNRYASVDNAQSRTINPDGSIPSTGSE